MIKGKKKMVRKIRVIENKIMGRILMKIKVK
jgi:hypothetical protein